MATIGMPLLEHDTAKGRENLGSNLGSGSEVGSEVDSREKLEADMREYFSHWMGGTSRTQAAIIGWLDRQAAITRAEMQGRVDEQSRAEIEDAERNTKAAQTARDCVDDKIVYGFEFCGTPSSTMLGETMFDYSGEPVGWIVANGLKGDCGHDADISDSREGLEEDVRGYYDEHECDTLMRVDFLDAVYAWLDRQAAITRAECDKPNWDYCETCEQLKAMQNEIAELKADNDCLRDRNEKLDYEVRDWKGEAKTQRNNFYQATEARKHWQRKYENLKATSYSAEAPSDESELARELGKALAERDMYREKLGRAVDAAHEIVRMMEVER